MMWIGWVLERGGQERGLYFRIDLALGSLQSQEPPRDDQIRVFLYFNNPSINNVPILTMRM